jgi:hypothetical protein
MIEDMAIRKLASKTQHDYVQRVKNFAAFLGRSPDTAKSEEVRGFRLHLASRGAGAPKINATISALRFFFNVTLDRPDLAKHLAFMREPGMTLFGHWVQYNGVTGGFISDAEPVIGRRYAPTRWRIPE